MYKTHIFIYITTYTLHYKYYITHNIRVNWSECNRFMSICKLPDCYILEDDDNNDYTLHRQFIICLIYFIVCEDVNYYFCFCYIFLSCIYTSILVLFIFIVTTVFSVFLHHKSIQFSMLFQKIWGKIWDIFLLLTQLYILIKRT